MPGAVILMPTTNSSVMGSAQWAHTKTFRTSPETPSAPCRAACTLSALPASGKTAKLAREIVALQDGKQLVQTEAAARALQGRVERAERWARPS